MIDGVELRIGSGTLHRFDVTDAPLPAEVFNPSTHAMGLRRGRGAGPRARPAPAAADRLWDRGESFEAGEGLSEAVQKTVEKLVLASTTSSTGAS